MKDEEGRESNKKARKVHSMGAHVLKGINKKNDAVNFREFTEILLAKQHRLFYLCCVSLISCD